MARGYSCSRGFTEYKYVLKTFPYQNKCLAGSQNRGERYFYPSVLKLLLKSGGMLDLKLTLLYNLNKHSY